MVIRVGCAGWAIPRAVRSGFPADGSVLSRYAAALPMVEIQSSFHRPHRPSTWARWATEVPPSFRFAVKVPKTITHDHGLIGAGAELERFLGEAGALGERLGPLLVQLPPSLAFDPTVARRFFGGLRRRFPGAVVCEPRHAGWFTAEASAVLVEAQVARVAADPPPVPGAEQPGGWPGLLYWRLHGSPQKYFSPYSADTLSAQAARMAAATVDAWCVLDNTGSGCAQADALALWRMVGEPVGRPA